jgi:toxin-antitoxin system PIN domain toxin
MNNSGTYLLDVNVLIALFDQAHIYHSAAHQWFENAANKGWGTCPITENGLLRILSSPCYPNSPIPIIDLSNRLEEFKKSSSKYTFWADDYSFSEWICRRSIVIGSHQSTDSYLLQLCYRKKGVLATFDQRIRPEMIGEKSSKGIEYVSI